MSQRFCIGCGHPNPGHARFCMNYGQQLAALAAAAAPPPVVQPGGAGLSGAAALIATLGLWHFSRKARQTAIVMLSLILFFGLPMACGFATFVLEWLGRLLH